MSAVSNDELLREVGYDGDLGEFHDLYKKLSQLPSQHLDQLWIEVNDDEEQEFWEMVSGYFNAKLTNKIMAEECY